MKTVFTPEALARSVANGAYNTCKLGEWQNALGDELFLFTYPSEDPLNEANGDGDFAEIIDFNADMTEVDVDLGFGGRTKTVKVTPDTIVYYRW